MQNREGSRATVVLVADDYDEIRYLCRTCLELYGCVVVEAENGEEAVELARRECPDLILMDLSMPVLDGLKATRRIRRIKELCDIPIVAVSGNGLAHRTEALAAGCDEYLVKPFDLVQLKNLLHKFLPTRLEVKQ